MNAIREEKHERALSLLGEVSVEGLDERAVARIKDAKTRWLATGAPHRRDEYWRYSDPAPLFSNTSNKTKALLVSFEAIALKLDDKLTTDSLQVTPLSTVLDSDFSAIEPYFGEIANRGSKRVERPIADLITAKARDGLVLVANDTNDEIFQIDYSQSQHAEYVHHVVHVKSGATLTLIETGDENLPAFSLMEVYVEAGGQFDHIRLQGNGDEHASASYIFGEMEDESEFHSFTLTGSAALRRNETVLTLKGRDSRLSIAGASYLGTKAHHDDTVFIEHCDENCVSRQVFKKVVRNGAKSVFQGKIYVHPEAQKTDGYQISQGLMLDENSEVYNKPELEIYADDVACSHGSTTSGADGDALFYLKSRGISQSDAQNMLAQAFLDEAIAEIRDEALQDNIRNVLARWIETAN